MLPDSAVYIAMGQWNTNGLGQYIILICTLHLHKIKLSGNGNKKMHIVCAKEDIACYIRF